VKVPPPFPSIHLEVADLDPDSHADVALALSYDDAIWSFSTSADGASPRAS